MKRGTLLMTSLFFLAGCNDPSDVARAQVREVVERLAVSPAPEDVLAGYPDGVMPDRDPWGKELLLTLVRDGQTEVFQVRSGGPDRWPYTDDDVVERRPLAHPTGKFADKDTAGTPQEGAESETGPGDKPSE